MLARVHVEAARSTCSRLFALYVLRCNLECSFDNPLVFLHGIFQHRDTRGDLGD